jgi:hypothetical protein
MKAYRIQEPAGLSFILVVAYRSAENCERKALQAGVGGVGIGWSRELIQNNNWYDYSSHFQFSK